MVIDTWPSEQLCAFYRLILFGSQLPSRLLGAALPVVLNLTWSLCRHGFWRRLKHCSWLWFVAKLSDDWSNTWFLSSPWGFCPDDGSWSLEVPKDTSEALEVVLDSPVVAWAASLGPSRVALALEISCLKSSSWTAAHPAPSKSFLITEVPPLGAPPWFGACPPWLLSHTSNSCRRSRFDRGLKESQLAFQRFTHSVWRLIISDLAPQLGIPCSTNFFLKAFSFSKE